MKGVLMGFLAETNKTYSAGAVSQNEKFEVPDVCYFVVGMYRNPHLKAFRQNLECFPLLNTSAQNSQDWRTFTELELKHARHYLILLLRKIGSLK